MKRRTYLAAALASMTAGRIHAQAWPSRPIRIIVPFAPGGSTGILARFLAQRLQDTIKTSFVIENRPGGGGTVGFLSGELLKQRASIDMVHIPYKGTGPAVIDMIAGQLDAVLDGPVAAGPYLRGGRVRALAVAGSVRLPSLPDVPAMDEVVPGTGGDAWFGISTQAGVPPEILAPLQTGLGAVVQHPDLQAKLAELGLTPRFMARTQYTSFIQNEIRKWGPVIRAAGVKGN